MMSSETWAILRLAWPVMVSRAGMFMIITIDTAMCGWAGTNELAYYGIASAPLFPALLIGIGMLLSVAIFTAGEDGAGKFEECGQIWKVGVLHALVLGVLLGMLLMFGETFLMLTGQGQELAEGGGRVLVMHGYGMAGLLAMIATSLFMEGLQRPLPAMFVMVGANILNIALNWVFIFGNLGTEATGAEGAALATTIVRWASFLSLATYILLTLDTLKYGIRQKLQFVRLRKISKRLRALGYPAAIAHFMESASFSVMTLFAGLLGILTTAVWSVTLQLIAIAFMFALGFTMAASVRIANHVGSRNWARIPRAGWTAAALGSVVMVLIGIAYYSGPEFFASLFTDDALAITTIIPVILIASIVMLPDGLQAVLVGALRGLQDMWYITLTMIISWWLVMLPSAYYFAVVKHYGAIGLISCLGGGAIVACLMLATRFYLKSRN